MSGKAINLEILQRRGVRVPQGFALGADHYRRHAGRIAEEIYGQLHDPNRIEAVFRRLRLDGEARRALTEALVGLAEVDRFAVRSSARVFRDGAFIGEDGADISLAGQFESYLNVPRARIETAVKRCWASLFNARSLERFRAGSDYVAKSEMTVVVQEMVKAKACAVMMTVDPQADGATGAIESAWGPCEVIVAGMVNPDEVLFDRTTGKVLSTSVGSKRCMVKYRAFMPRGDNVVRKQVCHRLQGQRALSDDIVRELINIGERIEGIFGYPQDVEVVIDHDDRIVVTQARNITSLPASFVPLNSVNT